MAQLMPLPLTVSCLSKIQIGFTFLVPAHPRYSLADSRSTVAYYFAANQAISTYIYIRIAADLRPSADGSAVLTSLVAGAG